MSTMILWSVFGYILGAIPFAFLLATFFTQQDIRRVGDGNPGGTNTWKVAGWKLGLVAILLEIFKGYLPVALARSSGLSDWFLLPVCLAPILGHATMPFLKFRGGKALGVTGGVWVGILGLWAFLVYAATALLLLILLEHAWAAVLGVSLFLVWAVVVEGELWMAVFGVLNVLLIAWTHRHDLGGLPHPRPWLAHLFLRNAR